MDRLSNWLSNLTSDHNTWQGVKVRESTTARSPVERPIYMLDFRYSNLNHHLFGGTAIKPIERKGTFLRPASLLESWLANWPTGLKWRWATSPEAYNYWYSQHATIWPQFELKSASRVSGDRIEPVFLQANFAQSFLKSKYSATQD